MRSQVLRRIVTEQAEDPRALRDALERELRKARGPFVEPLEGDPDSMLVTFVTVDKGEAAFLRSEIVPGLEGELEMQQVPGASDWWWAEATVPRGVATVYRFQHGHLALSEDLFGDPDALVDYDRHCYEASYADRFNPRRIYPMSAINCFGVAPGVSVPFDKWDSILELPGARPLPRRHATDASAWLHDEVVRSRVLGNERTVTIWRPPTPSTEDVPLVVLLDGEGFLLGAQAPAIFDELLASGRVPPFVAALVHNATRSSRSTEYRCNFAFTAFLADELVPVLRKGYRAGHEPRSTVIGGYSLGGLASNWAAYERPDVFGAVVSLSASLWWGPSLDAPGERAADERSNDGPEWLTRRYDAGERRAVRFFVEVGKLETAPLPFADGLDMVSTTRRFAAVLRRRGYELAGYEEPSGGHDLVHWAAVLPAALEALLG